MSNNEPQVLLEIKDLQVGYPVRWPRKGEVRAVDRLSLSIGEGQTLGLVGESGCGKSTLARAVVGLEAATAGVIRFAGERIDDSSFSRRQVLTRDIQMIYQDPYSSLNPEKTIEFIVSEGWRIHGVLGSKANWRGEVRTLLEQVGLTPELAASYPHQLSGGQRQRVGIARALALKPRLIVCDEPVSALDVSVQAQILNLLQDLQEKFNLSFLFIAHDLSVVRHISEDVAVMYLGGIMETGKTAKIYENPAHPYTTALLSAEPKPRPWAHSGREHIVLNGELPTPESPPSGCRFRTRCFMAKDRCTWEVPELRTVDGRKVACHFAEDNLARDRGESQSRTVGWGN